MVTLINTVQWVNVASPIFMTLLKKAAAEISVIARFVRHESDFH